MKKISFSEPEFEIINIDYDDAICTSGDFDVPVDGDNDYNYGDVFK